MTPAGAAALIALGLALLAPHAARAQDTTRPTSAAAAAAAVAAPTPPAPAAPSPAVPAVPATPAGEAPAPPPAGLVILLPNAAANPALAAGFVSPFTAATGIAAQPELVTETAARLRAMVPPPGAALLSGPDMLAACRDGIVDKLDPAQFGGKDRFLPQALADCGIGAVFTDLVLTWDRDKFPATPAGWADFWDVAKYPGKRGLRRGVRGNLEIALLADGVAPGDVYKTLRTDDGVERAFRKLDQLRPYIVWWDDANPAPRQLAAGDVLMSAASNVPVTEINRSEHRNFAMQWNGSIGGMAFWTLPHAAPHAAEGLQFIKFATDPKTLAGILSLAAYGLPVKTGVEGVAPEMLAASPNSRDHAGATLWLDDAFWRDNLDKLSQRFAAWMAR